MKEIGDANLKSTHPNAHWASLSDMNFWVELLHLFVCHIGELVAIKSNCCNSVALDWKHKTLLTELIKRAPDGNNKLYDLNKNIPNTIWNNRLICRNLYNNLEEYTWSVPNSSTAYIQVGSKFWNIYSVFFRPLALIKHSKHRDSSAEVFVSTRPWRVGLFCFGSGSGRFWPKSSGFRFGYCAYCGLKKSLVILCNSISCKGAELKSESFVIHIMLGNNWNIISTWLSL